MKPLVIYHASCFDGFCAAWVMRKIMPDAEFFAAQYGTPPPDVTGRRVVIVDFSYKRPVMLALIHAARGNVTVLDHHKTAEADLKGIETECYRDTLDCLPTVVFDMTKSGGRLAWESVCGGGLSSYANLPVPWLVEYTEDRDLWRHALPDSKAVNAALRSYPLDFETWDKLAEVEGGRKAWESFVSQGEAILRAERQVIDSHVRHAREVDFDGHKVLCVNATTLFSEIAGELAAGRPFGVCWFQRADGKFVYSLRSRDGGVDVSEIAEARGGGGHRGAAGFESQSPAA